MSRQHLARRVGLVVSAVLVGVWVAGGAASPGATAVQLGASLVRIGEVAVGDASPDPVAREAGRALGAAADGAGTSVVAAPGEATADADAGADTDVDAVSAATAEGVLTTMPMAAVGDLLLRVPAEQAELVAFHEAATTRALALVPSGALVRGGNDNPTRHEPHADADPSAVPYRVQVSRGRSASPTSAIDVVLADGMAVRSPVAGTVEEVRDYALYGRHEDVRVEVRPDDARELVVIMIHVRDPAVAPGQHVAAGDVIAAGARRFDFSSIVDNLVEPARLGHVHVEVARLAEVRAGRRAEAAATATP